VSQQPDFTGFESLIEVPGRDWIKVDGDQRTLEDKVWAGGDVTNLALVTDAVGHGRKAAEDIVRAFSGVPRVEDKRPIVYSDKMVLSHYEKSERQVPSHVGLDARMDLDTEVNLGFTAELAKLLGAPVLLVVNCSKATRTIAAIVLGCKAMDSELNVGGVILNQVANIRQELIIRESVEKETGAPVLGAIPRMKGLPFAERHLGLLPPQEHARTSEVLERLVEAVRNNVDIDAVWDLASSARTLTDIPTEVDIFPAVSGAAPRIGVLRDSAFTFYYPENLEALERHGAQVVELSGLRDETLPVLDALYIGGGFPETHAEELAKNDGFMASLRQEIDDGLPVYAECGGLIYLGRSVEFSGETHPMAGVFPVTFTVEETLNEPAVDFVVRGEGEVVFPALLN